MIAYLILAYVALGAQIGLTPHVRIGGAPPNLVLLAALFIALNAPKESALLGCFALGLMQDLLTTQTLGIYALSYGLVAMFVISTQQLVYRGHPLTHISIAFSASVICSIIILLHGVLRLAPEYRIQFAQLAYTTLYTTALSPIILGIMQKLRRAFRFQSRRTKI